MKCQQKKRKGLKKGMIIDKNENIKNPLLTHQRYHSLKGSTRRRKMHTLRSLRIFLSKLQLTLPFFEVLTQMPTYVKFLKDIIAHRRELNDVDYVDLNANCSVIIQNVMPKKRGDNGAFTIPIYIGDVSIATTLCDLGAGISLMPLSLFEKLIGSLTPTSLGLRLVDKTTRIPRGVLIDGLIEIGEFYVPVDMLEMEETSETSIILVRHFLNTVKALTNCGDGRIKLDLRHDKVKFYLKKITNAPTSSRNCSLIDVIDTLDAYDAFKNDCELRSFESDLMSLDDSDLSII